MNPIHFDLTLILQVIAFFVFLIPICAVIYTIVYLRRKQKQDQDILSKLNRIIELLEKDKRD